LHTQASLIPYLASINAIGPTPHGGGLDSEISATIIVNTWTYYIVYTDQVRHGTSVDVFESASERRGADGIDARA
jgi:hypothetical protein